ncbi:MAG: FAD-dependent oxidoreductase [Thermodesulfobacteriota bacterium]
MAGKKGVIHTDLVIVGYGLAGATAAIAAQDAGAKVVLLEKGGHFGGNSILAGGGVLIAEDPEGAFQYLQALCGGKTGDEVIRAQVRKMTKIEDFLRALCKVNGALLTKRNRPGIYPFPGRDAINSLIVDEIPGFQGYPWIMTIGGGALLMKVMEDNVNLRKIPVMTSTRAIDLLTDGHGAVTGVLAQREGEEVTLKTKKAVILACGGFEHHDKLKDQYLPAKPYYSMAPLTHTGDGIVMSMKLGVSLWHMTHVHGSYGFKYPEFPIAFRHHIDGAREPYGHRPSYIKMRWILIDRKGKRFMNEYPPAPQDTPHRDLSHFDPELPGFPRIPCFLIFDETARKARHLARPLGLKEGSYEWSEDNSREIEKGWIVKGESLDELARKINVPSSDLNHTVKRWNESVRLGQDTDFGRPSQTMFAPIESPPYYAMESWPILANTQGGPEHNEKQQVLHISGKPIPRLYAVGELGSLFGYIYELGGNLGECVASGLIAAENACEEEPLSKR